MPQTSQYNPRSNPFPRNSVKRPTKRRSFASNGEEEVRRVLEDHYQVKFDNCRPNFLKNPETGSNLELDCYNKELKIAAEYQGVQHYRFPNPFHKTKKEFIDQLYRDKIKVKLCEENNVYLIRVPYTVPFNKIKDYVMERIPENYEPSATNTMEEDVSNYYEDQDYTMEEDEYDD